MSDVSPDLDRIRADWIDHKVEYEPHLTTNRYDQLASVLGKEFDHAIQKIRADAEAEVIEEVIESIRWVYELQCPVKPSAHYIHPAARIAHKWWETVLGGRLKELEIRAAKIREGR
ncbi:hypothetical protein [Glutamicibacter creatinolyticus]|uniref:hypothetical protein n=1 Tax=Glutamicibacter creatinolyticus TaxID=162496 RepID=UPI0031D31D63